MQLNAGIGAKAVRVLGAFRRDRSGVTSIEYALIITLIALAIVVAAGVLGVNLNGIFMSIAESPAWG